MNVALAVADASQQPSPPSPIALITAVIVRMADEGIPVAAIARSVRLPSEEVRDILTDAHDKGVLVTLPKHEWPNGSSRDTRAALASAGIDDDATLQVAIARCFRATRLEAAICALLLKRNEVTKLQLHHVIEQQRAPNKEPTNPKMVDVVICHLRKKLKLHTVAINTVWGTGYLIPLPDREKAINLLTQFSTAAGHA